MADAQYKYGVWTSAGPERAAAPGVIPPPQHEYVDKTEGLDELDTRDQDSDFSARCNRRARMSSAVSQLVVAAPRLAAEVRRSIRL